MSDAWDFPGAHTQELDDYMTFWSSNKFRQGLESVTSNANFSKIYFVSSKSATLLKVLQFPDNKHISASVFSAESLLVVFLT